MALNIGSNMGEPIGIIGSAGRMGQALSQAITAAGDSVAGGIDRGGDPLALARASRALVDFSSPDALEANLDAAAAAGTPIVIGTTGLAERHHWLIDQAAERIAVLQTGNTSLGVNLLAYLVREAAARLGRRLGYRDRRDASPAQARCSLGHCVAARRGGGRGARHRAGRT